MVRIIVIIAIISLMLAILLIITIIITILINNSSNINRNSNNINDRVNMNGNTAISAQSNDASDLFFSYLSCRWVFLFIMSDVCFCVCLLYFCVSVFACY